MGSTYSALANLDDNDLILNQSENNNLDHQPPSIPSQYSIQRPPPVHKNSINWLSVVRPEMIVSCSSDNTIVLNNMDTCNCVTRWKGHQKEINKVLYKHSGSQHFVLSGSKDCSIRLWRFNETECVQTFNGHQFGVTGLAAFGEENFISGARDGKLFMWNIEHANQPICSSNISNSQNIITHIEVDNENKILFQTAEDGAIRFWDINNLSLIETIPSSGGHQPKWHCSRLANFEPNALLTAEGGDGNEIKHWDIRQRSLIQRFRGHEKDVRAAIFLQSQPQITSKRLMLSVSNDRTIRLWDVNNGKCIWTENNITAELNCCADFTNGRVVVCGRDATLCELRLMAKAGRPFLRCISYQCIED